MDLISKILYNKKKQRLVKVLAQLATDKNSDVRCRVARNPNTPHFAKKSLKIKELLMKL